MAHDPMSGEADRFPGAPHPRERSRLIGQDAAEETFLSAFKSGKLHHAWLIGGPQGVGKATFAYRAARFLLANGGGQTGADSLFVPPDHPVARNVAVLSHPDMAVLRRTPAGDKKGPSSIIPVDAVRAALHTFASTAGAGGWRVCIVDEAGDLNASGANALLKVLEEPPPRSIFLIVSHAPGRLLPTIRSRCRQLTFPLLSESAVIDIMADLGPPWSSLARQELEAAAGRGEGSVWRALEFAAPETRALVSTIENLLDALPRLETAAIMGLAETLSGKDAADDFQVACDIVHGWLAARIRARAGEGAARLAPLVEVWEKIAHSVREADIFNLDKRPVILSMFGELSDAVRRSGGR